MDEKLLIELLGGTGKMAEICQVTPGAVSQWKEFGIPRARMMFLRVAFPKECREAEKAAGQAAEGAPA